MLATALLPTAFSGDSIIQHVHDGTNVSVGFDALEPGPHNLSITLQANGSATTIYNSWVNNAGGTVIWTSSDNNTSAFEHHWTANGVYANDVTTPTFGGYTNDGTPPMPYGFFQVSVAHVDLDVPTAGGGGPPPWPGQPDPADEAEATTGVGIPITNPGPSLPGSFPSSDTTGVPLSLSISGAQAGTLRLEIAGTGAAAYRQDAETGDWVKVQNDITISGGAGAGPLTLHTDNGFTGAIFVTARFFPSGSALAAADRVKLFPQGTPPPPTNNPPEFQGENMPGYYDFTIGEGSQIDMVAGEVTATDGDGDALIYTITSGNDAGYFRIDVDANQRAWLTVAKDLPIDTAPPNYVLTIEVADTNGGKDTSTVTLTPIPLVVITGDLHGTEATSPVDSITLTFVRFAKDKSNSLAVLFTYDPNLLGEVSDPVNLLVDGYATIPAGSDRVSYTLQPNADGQTEGAEKFKVTLTPDAAYTLGSSNVIVDKANSIQSSGKKEVEVVIMDAIRLFAPFNASAPLQDDENLIAQYIDPKALDPGPPIDAGVSLNDINQGAVGDCYLLAAIGAIAMDDPNKVRGFFDISTPGSVSAKFYPSLGAAPVTKTVPFTLTLGSAQAKLSGDDNDSNNRGEGAFTESWPTIMEQLYAQFTGVAQFYTNDGWVYRVWEQIYDTAHFKAKASNLTNAQLEALVRSKVGGRLVISIESQGPGKGPWGLSNGNDLVGDHAYVVMSIFDNLTPGDPSDDEIRLYNPWGDSYKRNLPFADLKKVARWVYHQ